MTILFVCSGNIHRSAHAEAILRAEAARDGRTDIEVHSAGVMAVEGMEPPPQAMAAARRAGLDLASHRSRPADAPLLLASELILVMEEFHLSWVEQRHPTLAERCRLLTRHAGDISRSFGVAPGDDVPDAIGEDDDSFHRSFSIIQECVRRLYRELPPAPQEVYAGSIEGRFRMLRQTPLSLSPADYALVERWWSRGVPLWIVLGSLDDLLARRQSTRDATRVRRLTYVEPEVEERFAAYQHSREGTDGREPASGVGDQMAQAAETLRDAARRAALADRPEIGEVLAGMANRIAAETGRAMSGDSAGLWLHQMDDELTRRLVALTGEDEVAVLRRQAANRLAGFRDRMTPEAFDATVTRLVGEQVRSRLALRPLSGT